MCRARLARHLESNGGGGAVSSWLAGVAQSIGTAGILGCLAYLRSIRTTVNKLADSQYSDELHLLAHAQRLEALERSHP